MSNSLFKMYQVLHNFVCALAHFVFVGGVAVRRYFFKVVFVFQNWLHISPEALHKVLSLIKTNKLVIVY